MAMPDEPRAAPIHGTLAITQAAQTVSASGLVRNIGGLAVTQAAETLSAHGGVLVRCALAEFQAAHTVAAGGWSACVGVLVATQVEQLSSSAAVAIGGALNVEQQEQGLAASVDVLVGADLALTAAADAAAATGAIQITGSLVEAHADHTMWYDVAIFSDIGAALYVAQDDWALDADVSIAIGGALSKTPWRDMLSATGAVVDADAIYGGLSVQEAHDGSSGGIYALAHAHAAYSVSGKRSPTMDLIAP